MFAKLFARITESSLMEEDIPVRYTFVMLLAIADLEGDVVGTDIAISRRLNMPLKEFQRCVQVLSTPDKDSNSKEMDGRRIVAAEAERGYKVVNYQKYRALTSEFQKKNYMRNYMREYRERGKTDSAVKLTESYSKTEVNMLAHASLTSVSASESSSGSGKGSAEGKPNVEGIRRKIGGIYGRDEKKPWNYLEESTFVALAKSPHFENELELIIGYRKKLPTADIRYFPQSLESLLSNWNPTVDKARTQKPGSSGPVSLIDKEIQSLCSPQ